MKYIVGFLLLLGCQVNLFAQHTTYSNDGPKLGNEREKKYDVLVVPFEPKLYLSEIDQRINQETGLNFEQIRNAFRNGSALEVAAAFQPKYQVLALIDDTTWNKKEERLIYESIVCDYLPLPVVEGKKQKADGKVKPTIKEGQLMVTTNDLKRYMHTRIVNPNLLSLLHKKYGATIFVFLNELDLKHDRLAILHYTAFDNNGKLIASGIGSKDFPITLNDPKKIMPVGFKPIAEYIYSTIVPAPKGK